jgi:hypothetical protein
MTNKLGHSQFPSIKLDQLVYVEIEENNGGMMLSISEEGFSFRAVSPVRPNGRIPFAFSINGIDKLGGFGKIEWTQDDGKVAGLHFTDVTSEFLATLRKWLAQMSVPAASSSSHNNGSRLEQPVSEPAKEPIPEFIVDDSKSQVKREVGSNFGQSFTAFEPNLDSSVQAPSCVAQAHPPERNAPVLSEWSYPSGLQEPARPRVNRLALTAVAVFFVALIILLYGYREEVGQSLISLGQKMSSSSETSQSQPIKEPETQKPAMEPKTIPATPATTESIPAPQSESANPRLSTDVRSAPANSTLPEKTDAAFRDARPAPTVDATAITDSRSHDPADQVRSLWSAVAQGNTSAEVTLAKLYLIGGGVTKSCDQARVLLQAAAKKGNGEALDKLSQINQQGCP